MYAVIATGGKQYRVQPGDTLRVEKLDGEPGKTIEFTDVLLVADGDNVRVGAPHVAGAKVVAEFVANGRGEKLLIFKYRRRKGYRRKNGHRQPFTALKITSING
jgi:large subunit ribosomal protein L21